MTKPAPEAPPAIPSAPASPPPGAPAASGASLAAQATAHLEAHRAGTAGRFTLQLMVACNPASVERLRTAPGAGERLWFIPYVHQGKACFKVFWGDYASVAEAEAARAALPGAVAGGLPRIPVVSVKRALQ